MANNPEYLKDILRQREAKQMAMHSDYIYGTPERAGSPVRAGFPMANPEAMVPGKRIPGTGLYSKEGTPEERYLQAQQRMGSTGIASFLEERQALLKSMQESVMRGENAGPNNDKMSASRRLALEMGLVEGTPAYYDFIERHAFKSGQNISVSVGQGDQERLDPNTAIKFVNQYGNHPVTVEDLNSGEYFAASEGSQLEERKSQGSAATIDEIERAWEEMLDVPALSDNPLAVRAEQWVRASTPLKHISPEHKSYADISEGAVGLLIKGLGEAGALSDSDIKRARTLLPQPGEDPVVAKEKFNKLRNIITRAERNKSLGLLQANEYFKGAKATSEAEALDLLRKSLKIGETHEFNGVLYRRGDNGQLQSMVIEEDSK
jgi:hypothetical protein